MVGGSDRWLPVFAFASTNRNTRLCLQRSRLANFRQRHMKDLSLLLYDTVLLGKYFPEELSLHQHCCENLKFCKDL